MIFAYKIITFIFQGLSIRPLFVLLM